MKIGIVTITNGPFNYGNQLQNYAVTFALNKLGHECKTIFNVNNAHYLVSPKHWMKNIVYSLLNIGDCIIAKKELSYLKFIIKHIKYTRPVNDLIPQSWISYFDYFVVGSDQVWNPGLCVSKEHWNYLLLNFAPESKRIAFAPSIGIASMPEDSAKIFRQSVLKYKELSVREEAGAKIIKDLTNREPDILIDPTLLLTASEWDVISEKPKNVDFSREYIVTYFLGGRSKKVDVELEKYKKSGYYIYNLLDEEQPNIFILNPAHFLYLISHAKLILTDSFHACVFSFIYDRPFLVYAREGKETNMLSRLETLLDKFELQRKYVDSGLQNEIFEHDYTIGKKILIHEQKKAWDFLEKSLEE